MIFKVNSVKIIKKRIKSLFLFGFLELLRRKTMKLNVKLIALLLVIMLALTSCEATFNEIIGQITDAFTTTTTTTTTPTTTTTTTSTTTGKPEPEQPKFSRLESSTTVAELLEMYTLTEEYVNETLALIDAMYEASLDPESTEAFDAIYEQFDERFYHVAQQMTIARIIYYTDMSDEVATERQLTTTDYFYDIQDKYNETCRSMYLDSPHKDELFADWTEEEIQSLLDYDSTTVALKKEIEDLQAEYNNLGNHNFTDGSAELYAQIVTKNNQLAKLYGYDNYYDYAQSNVYGREYTTEELQQFKAYVKQHVMPRFTRLNNGWQKLYDLPTVRKDLAIDFLTADFDAMEKNYVMLYLDSLGDTNMGNAMRDVFENKRCIFSNNRNSHPTAFQTYFYEDEHPFCLFGSNGQTSNTIIHEIGHYYAATVNNDLSSYDLLETHSQGNEYLYLKFSEDNLPSSVYEPVRYYNLFNSWYTIVMASIIDDFEYAVYNLESVEGYTSAEFDAIMDEVLAGYGRTADWFTENVTDPYNYWRSVAVDNPCYYISYAVSAAASVIIFAEAEEDYEATMAKYVILAEGVTEEDGFIEALKKAGFTTPFDEESFVKISQTMRK